MDLQIGTSVGNDSPALEVACPPPGIGATILESLGAEKQRKWNL
jgi:hypothetical protein